MISARFRLKRALVSALLAVVVIAVYAPVTTYQFVNIDDAEYVTENANINSGFSPAAIKWIFENPVCGNWHPLTMFSHMLDCQIYGLNPGGHHFTNLLLHVANTLLLFWILLAMTNEGTDSMEAGTGKASKNIIRGPPNILPSALVAALFGLHPLHVESVAWVSERKDVLSAFFFMLTLWVYFNYAAEKKIQGAASKVPEPGNAPAAAVPQRRSFFMRVWNRVRHPGTRSWYILSLIFFALGLMSKPMLVTLPFVLLLLDYWPLGRLMGEKLPMKEKGGRSANCTGSVIPLVLEKLPFLLLAAIFSVVTFFAQKGCGAVVTLGVFPMEARLTNAMVTYAHYLGKTFWPDSLALGSQYQNWAIGKVVASTVLVAGLSLIAVLTAHRRRYVFVGWFWFAGMLVPVIGLVQVGLHVMADRYTYLPLIGIFIILAWGLAELATSPVRSALVVSGASLAVALLAATTVGQVHHWKNSETLFEHAAQATDKNTTAHYILGKLLGLQGRTNEAISQLTVAIRDYPANANAHCCLGYILRCQGKLDEAATEYQIALRIEPNSADAHFGLADVLRDQHKLEAATSHYLLSLESDPNNAETHYHLAGCLSGRHDPTNAMAQLEEAVRLKPSWIIALNDLAWMLATQPESNLRNGPEAVRLALREVGLTRGNDPNTLDTLAAAYAETGRFADAVETAENALQKAKSGGQTNLAPQIEIHLRLYQSRQAYRE